MADCSLTYFTQRFWPGRAPRARWMGVVHHRSVPLVVDWRVAVVVGIRLRFKPGGSIVLLFNWFPMEYNRSCSDLIPCQPARAGTRTGPPGRRSAAALRLGHTNERGAHGRPGVLAPQAQQVGLWR